MTIARSKTIIVALGVLMLLTASAIAAHPQENFSNFFQRFASDNAFRISRVSEPIKVMLDPTQVPPKEYDWPKDQVEKEMVAPRPKAKLAGLKEKVTRQSKTAVKVTQMEPETDTYRHSYYFRQIDGQWFLYRYEDTSL